MRPDPKKPHPRLRDCLPYIESRTEDASFTGRVIHDYLHGTLMGTEFDEKVKPEEMAKWSRDR